MYASGIATVLQQYYQDYLNEVTVMS